MIGLPLLDQLIAAAYKHPIGSLLLSGDTSLASRAKSCCEFGRPEAKDRDFVTRFSGSDINGNFVIVSGSTYRCLSLGAQDTRIFAT